MSCKEPSDWPTEKSENLCYTTANFYEYKTYIYINLSRAWQDIQNYITPSAMSEEKHFTISTISSMQDTIKIVHFHRVLKWQSFTKLSEEKEPVLGNHEIVRIF